jgi:hypothetical protein
MMTKEELLASAGINTPSFVTADRYTPLPSDYQKSINEKRAELEIKKLEIELENLSKPNTSIDYFKQMLDLQQNHFNQLLTMQKEQQTLMLEIEKLKMGGESDDSMLYMLDIIKPILPSLLAKKGIDVPTQGEKPKLNKEQYLEKIRDGTITPEMGYEDFKLEFPDLAKNMTFEQFKVQFENVKKNGIPTDLKS